MCEWVDWWGDKRMNILKLYVDLDDHDSSFNCETKWINS